MHPLLNNFNKSNYNWSKTIILINFYYQLVMSYLENPYYASTAQKARENIVSSHLQIQHLSALIYLFIYLFSQASYNHLT